MPTVKRPGHGLGLGLGFGPGSGLGSLALTLSRTLSLSLTVEHAVGGTEARVLGGVGLGVGLG